MRKTFIFIFILLFALKAQSQKMSQDTIVARVVKSNWAIRFHGGINSLQIFNHPVNSIPLSSIYTWEVYYKGFSLMGARSFLDMGSDENTLTGSMANLELGYAFDLSKNWSPDVKVGLHNSGLSTPNYFQSDFESLFGGILGVGLNKYVKVKRYNYLVARVGVDFIMANYSLVNPDFSNGAVHYSLTVGYKGWFKKYE